MEYAIMNLSNHYSYRKSLIINDLKLYLDAQPAILTAI